MFTSNSTLLSRDITTIITNSFGAIGNIFDRTLNQIIKSLFSNNEQGFAYDPNDLSTMYQDSVGTIPVTAEGQPVGLILDKSGRNNHARQTTSASRPILRQNVITGAYYLAFDGADDFLQTNNIDFTSTDKVSLFAGVRKLSDYYTGKIVELSNSVGNIGTFSLNAPDSNGASNFAFATNGVALSDVKVSGFASPTSAVLTAFGNNAASTLQLKNRLRVNGVYPTATYGGSIGAGNYGNYPLYIGRRGGISQPFNGHIYSLIGIGRLTTDAETVALEKLIAKNIGVTLS